MVPFLAHPVGLFCEHHAHRCMVVVSGDPSKLNKNCRDERRITTDGSKCRTESTDTCLIMFLSWIHECPSSWPTVRSILGYDMSSICNACIVAKPYVVGVGDGTVKYQNSIQIHQKCKDCHGDLLTCDKERYSGRLSL